MTYITRNSVCDVIISYYSRGKYYECKDQQRKKLQRTFIIFAHTFCRTSSVLSCRKRKDNSEHGRIFSFEGVGEDGPDRTGRKQNMMGNI